MRICIPTTNATGLAGRLSPHFGKAPYFTYVDVETSRAEAFPNPSARHEKGRCDPAAIVESTALDAVVCMGMGPGALGALRSRGVPVLKAEAWTVAEVVQEFRKGKLRRLDPEHAARHASQVDDAS